MNLEHNDIDNTQVYYNYNNHDVYAVRDLCVVRKYNTLKEEIFHNKFYNLDPLKWVTSTKKVEDFIVSQNVKQMKASFIINDPMHYGIKNDDQISVLHLLSVVLYVDYSDLCFAFSKTFKRKSAFETLSMVKKRNAEFAIWSMLIPETIEYFGIMLWRYRNLSSD